MREGPVAAAQPGVGGFGLQTGRGGSERAGAACRQREKGHADRGSRPAGDSEAVEDYTGLTSGEKAPKERALCKRRHAILVCCVEGKLIAPV